MKRRGKYCGKPYPPTQDRPENPVDKCRHDMIYPSALVATRYAVGLKTVKGEDWTPMECERCGQWILQRGIR